MIKVLIVEDEVILGDHLVNLLNKYCSSVTFDIEEQIESIVGTIAWFEKNDCPDLIFMDVHLSDGVCFEIFNKVEVTCPIIYTTAYDEHVIEAFKTNGIDYLLKPIGEKDFYQTIVKFLKMRRW